MCMVKPKKATRQSREKATLTQSISFERDTVYATLEEQREVVGRRMLGKAMPRSEYVALALVEKWKRDGVWPRKG